MKRRIFALAFLLAAAAAVLACVLTAMAAYGNYFNAVRGETAAYARHAGAGVEIAGRAYLTKARPTPGHRLTWVASDGTVLFDSAADADQMENHGDRPEIAAALASGVGDSTRHSDTLNVQTYYYAVRLADGTVLRVATTVSRVLDSFRSVYGPAAGIVALVFIGAAAAASRLTRGIVQPFNTLDLDHTGDIAVYDELAPLLQRIREQRRQIDAQLESLTRQRADFSAVTENMSEGFVTLDLNGAVLSCNPSALGLLGSSFQDATGRHIFSVNRCEGLRVTVEAALAGRAAESVLSIGGRDVLAAAQPVSDGGGLRGITLMLMDITEQRARERMRREFTANVSHELKTPLTVLSGSAELLMNGMVEPQDVQRFGSGMYKEAGRLIALVNDLLFLSRLDEGKTSAFEPVDLLALSKSAAERGESKAAARGVTLSAAGAQATINGSHASLEAMVFNLVDNAIKYNIDNGSVTVTVSLMNGAAALAVEDTGIGIPKDERERVFERFYRVDKSRGDAIPGTGLGLAIVKHAAMIHGARVDIDSGKRGTKITVVFPAELTVQAKP